MHKVEALRRIIGYNRLLEDVLIQRQLPFIRMYMGYERPFEVQLKAATLLVTLVPLKDQQVRLIIMPKGMFSKTSISSFPDVLLKQKLMQFFKELS